jgi:heme exporter protein CcmD
MNFDLGPYADFIWPAYAVSALGLLGATVWTLSAWRKAKARLAALERK